MFLNKSSRLRRWFFLDSMTGSFLVFFRLVFFRFPPPSCFLTVFFAVRSVAFLIEDLPAITSPSSGRAASNASLPSFIAVGRIYFQKIGKAVLATLPAKAPNPCLFVEVYVWKIRSLYNQPFSRSVRKKMKWKVVSITISASSWKAEMNGSIRVKKKELVFHYVVSDQ